MRSRFRLLAGSAKACSKCLSPRWPHPFLLCPNAFRRGVLPGPIASRVRGTEILWLECQVRVSLSWQPVIGLESVRPCREPVVDGLSAQPARRIDGLAVCLEPSGQRPPCPGVDPARGAGGLSPSTDSLRCDHGQASTRTASCQPLLSHRGFLPSLWPVPGTDTRADRVRGCAGQSGGSAGLSGFDPGP